MLMKVQSPEEKRKQLRRGLESGKLLQFPGAFSPLVAQLVEELGFDGVYISGAVLSNDLGYPDIGLTTLTEVSQRGRQISRVTNLPSIIDIDTGFGEPMNVVRTILELHELGISGCHLEDQINPKRCGHLDNKGLVETSEMVKKVRAASEAKRDPNFVLMARTDARASEGLEKAIDRAKAYVDAGADMIFPEALQNEGEFEAFRKAISVPLLANMTEFGKSKLLDKKTLESLGYNIVIYPVTTLRLAMHAVEEGLKFIKKEGTQNPILDQMQHRKRLYELVRYEDYNEFDKNVYNFTLKN
ncbi:MAG: methylisocitrate lyase [Bdellovibrionales bacterium]|nr:methylisocitrate lyase [Bdellovibrionales bacterium]